MNDKGFLDTNIVVYAYSHDEPDKQLIAKNLFKKPNPVISTQVLGEFSNEGGVSSRRVHKQSVMHLW